MSVLLAVLGSLLCGFCLAFFRQVFVLIVLIAIVTIAASLAALFGDVEALSVFGLWFVTVLGLQAAYFAGLLLRTALRVARVDRDQLKGTELNAADLNPDKRPNSLKLLAADTLRRLQP